MPMSMCCLPAWARFLGVKPPAAGVPAVTAISVGSLFMWCSIQSLQVGWRFNVLYVHLLNLYCDAKLSTFPVCTITRNAEENTLIRHPRPPAPHSAVCSSLACSYTLYIIESSSFVFPVRCISRRSTLRQPVQHAPSVIAAYWLFCICGFVFFWQQSLFVLAAFFIYVSCLVKSPYQGCVWPYKAF